MLIWVLRKAENNTHGAVAMSYPGEMLAVGEAGTGGGRKTG